jgi:hypothetical protein
VRNQILRARRTFIIAMAGTVAAIAMSGCSSESGGTPTPITQDQNPNKSPSSTAASGGVFGDLEACNVLDKALDGQGFEAAVVDKAGGDNGCDAEKYMFATVSLDLQPNIGIDELNADPSNLYEGQVNGRSSMQIREGLGSEGNCDIALEVAEDSRAMTGVSLATGSTDEACDFILEVAKKVEPQLPKGN